MEQHRKSLARGVELVTTRTEQFKTGVFSVTLTAPLARETATAYALIPEVLYRGSRLYPDMERLSAAADRLYGASLNPAVRQRGESQCISLLCSFIDDHYALDGTAILEPAAELMGQVLLDPVTENGVFRRDYVAGEGENLAFRIRARINDKQDWAVFRLIQEMCAGEAYAVDKLGDADEALAMTPERLWERYQALLRGARVTFYYSGSADEARAEAAVRRAFEPLLTDREAPVDCRVKAGPGGPVRRAEDVMDVTQGKLALGFRTGGITMTHPDYPALLVCCALYGGTAHSKLFQNVRERLSLCYYASSALDKLKGLMVVSSGVEFSDFQRTEDEILVQLDAIRAGDVTEEELTAAVRSVVNSLRGRKDSQGQMEDDCLTRLLAGCELNGDGELIARVEQVTAEQVSAAARRIELDTVYRLAGKEG